MNKADVTMSSPRPPLDPTRVPLIATGGDPSAGYTIMQALALTAGQPPNQQPAAASPILATWLAAWADSLPHDPRQHLRRYIWHASHSRGTAEQEALRCWLVRDWLVRVRSAIWLQGAGLGTEAKQLDDLSLPYDPANLRGLAPHHGDWFTTPRPAGWTDRQAVLPANAGGSQRLAGDNSADTVIATATTAADRSCENAWRTVAAALRTLGQHHYEQWWAMADATWPTAHAAARRLLLAAATAGRLDAARGLLRRPDGRPRTIFDAACDIAINAAGTVAWSALASTAMPNGAIWQTSPQDAWIMASDIAGEATSSVRDALDRSAHQLVDQLLAATSRGERQ